MTKLFIEDLPIAGKRVLMRVDFNVPLDGEGYVSDSTRIIAALPSIRYVLDHGGSLILMSHLGRPHNEPSPDLSLIHVAKILESLLEKKIEMAPNCIGEEVRERVAKLKQGEILLLENLRFHRAETHPEEDPNFAKELASFGDLYVNDAFGTAHRKHSSTYTITQHFQGRAAAGYLLQKEIHFLGEILSKPNKPFHAILGGAKISTKMGVIKTLLKKADRLLIGGGMAYTFLKAKGIEIGDSLIENDLLDLARELIEIGGEKIVLPLDVVCACEPSEEAPTLLVDLSQSGIPAGYQGLDIGPKTIEDFCKILDEAKTLLWNGPLGMYELDPFTKGTIALATHIGKGDAVSIVGGGDLAAALNQAGVSDSITHISTGGGATLEYVERGTLPCIEVLSDKLKTLGKC